MSENVILVGHWRVLDAILFMQELKEEVRFF
jgi:hypothetical protein